MEKEENENEVKKENGKKSKVIGIVLGGIGSVIAGLGIGAILAYNLAYNSPGDVAMYGVPESSEAVKRRTFNSNFTPYAGEKQSASQIRALSSAVDASNASDERKVKLDMSGVTLKSSRKYKVTITEYVDGYISEIIVEEE